MFQEYQHKQFEFSLSANKRAKMTRVVFEEYIRWFDKKIHGRKVLFIVDKMITVWHIQKILNDYKTLSLFFLSSNMTSKIQHCNTDWNNKNF